MNYLVNLNPLASELEKILSGIKTMILKEFNPIDRNENQVKPGDTLYFLREKDEYSLRAAATVVRVLPVMKDQNEELSNILKEMQPKLQLTEQQYNDWAVKKQVLLVEFESAHKIPILQLAPHKVLDLSDWIAVEEFSFITA